MYICIYICIYKYIYIYMYIYTYIHIFMYIYVHMCLCIYIYIYTHILHHIYFVLYIKYITHYVSMCNPNLVAGWGLFAGVGSRSCKFVLCFPGWFFFGGLAADFANSYYFSWGGVVRCHLVTFGLVWVRCATN